MEEQKRLKELEKQKLKKEEEEMDRRMELDREQKLKREHEELVKDGKRDPNAPYIDEKKRQVRID